MSTYLITGITGTLGKIVARHLLWNRHRVIGLSRDEFKQSEMFKHDNLKLHIGDIKDFDSICAIKEHIDVIFHFAAMKHVNICNDNMVEAIKTNVTGTTNILNYQEMCNVRQLIFTSTDKAFRPINLYGKTKSIAESIVAGNDGNAICRYGNVFGSRGSVVHKFLSSLRSNHTVEITDPTMTRFFMTQKEAANFVMACEYATGIHIPKMKSTDLSTLAKACAIYLGIDEFDVVIIGNRGKEKIHEEMSEDYNSETAERFTLEELVLMIKDIDK